MSNLPLENKNHNFIINYYNYYNEYVCKKCNIMIIHEFSPNAFPIWEIFYKSNDYGKFYLQKHILQNDLLSCEEVIIKNLIE